MGVTTSSLTLLMESGDGGVGGVTTSPSVRVKEVSAVMPSKMSVKEVITSSLAGLTNFLINFHFHLGRVDYLYSDTFRENTHRSQ